MLCAAPHCRARGRHLTDCVADDCRGCLPRQAADGLYLCSVCHERIGEDALLLVARYSDLELVLTGGRAMGELVSSSKDPNLSINERAADLRQDIARALDQLCAWISRQRGITPPRAPGVYKHAEELPRGFVGPPRMLQYQIDAVLENASFVGRHRDWLAAQPGAGDTSQLLHDLAHGESYRVAYPSGGRSWPIQTGPGKYAICPEDGCEGVLWSVIKHSDSPYPAQLVCDTTVGEQHSVPFVDWFRKAQKLRTKAGVADEPAPPRPRGHRVSLIGGPFDGATHTITVSPPPTLLRLTHTDDDPASPERRYTVAYTRRTETEYHYVGATS